MTEAARELDLAHGTLRAAVRDRKQLPAPTTRVGRRLFYSPEAFAELSQQVDAARQHGFFPRLSERGNP
jgi:hypothetical protein